VLQQRRVLFRYLQLAMTLSRTLVLPRFRLLRGGWPGDPATVTYEDWSELFNLSTLNTLHPSVELEAYFEGHGTQIHQLHVLDSQGCLPAKEQVAVFNGITGVLVGQKLCSLSQQEDDSLYSVSNASIGFSGSMGLVSSAAQFDLRPYVRFSQHVYDAAAAYIVHAFAGEPFMAVHWHRQRGSPRPHAGSDQSAHGLVRHARRLMKQHGVRRVFLATNSHDRIEMAQVNAKMQPVQYSLPVDAVWDATAVTSIEVAICSMATYFLGTHAAELTSTVFEERIAVFGHAPETGFEMAVGTTQTIESLQRSHSDSSGSGSDGEMGGGRKDEL